MEKVQLHPTIALRNHFQIQSSNLKSVKNTLKMKIGRKYLMGLTWWKDLLPSIKT